MESLIIEIMIGLVTTFVALEVTGFLNRFSRWLVRTAAQKLPAEERERFIEQNLADLDAIEGPLSKVYNAFDSFSAVVLAPAAWNVYAAFRGLTDFFDLPPRAFQQGETIWVAHRPKRPAIVHNWLNPTRAANDFPNGVIGAPKPPYIDGIVEVNFQGRDPFGREYPREFAAGTSVERRV
jgi:hypothetical protein